MSDLIHVNELIGKLSNTAFKDGDDREIAYNVIRSIKPESVFNIEENEELRCKIEELRLALEHNEKVYEDKERRLQWEADMRFRDGYIKALKYALVCVVSGGLDRQDYE